MIRKRWIVLISLFVMPIKGRVYPHKSPKNGIPPAIKEGFRLPLFYKRWFAGDK